MGCSLVTRNATVRRGPQLPNDDVFRGTGPDFRGRFSNLAVSDPLDNAGFGKAGRYQSEAQVRSTRLKKSPHQRRRRPHFLRLKRRSTKVLSVPEGERAGFHELPYITPSLRAFPPSPPISRQRPGLRTEVAAPSRFSQQQGPRQHQHQHQQLRSRQLPPLQHCREKEECSVSLAIAPTVAGVLPERPAWNASGSCLFQRHGNSRSSATNNASVIAGGLPRSGDRSISLARWEAERDGDHLYWSTSGLPDEENAFAQVDSSCSFRSTVERRGSEPAGASVSKEPMSIDSQGHSSFRSRDRPDNFSSPDFQSICDPSNVENYEFLGEIGRPETDWMGTLQLLGRPMRNRELLQLHVVSPDGFVDPQQQPCQQQTQHQDQQQGHHHQHRRRSNCCPEALDPWSPTGRPTLTSGAIEGRDANQTQTAYVGPSPSFEDGVLQQARGDLNFDITVALSAPRHDRGSLTTEAGEHEFHDAQTGPWARSPSHASTAAAPTPPLARSPPTPTPTKLPHAPSPPAPSPPRAYSRSPDVHATPLPPASELTGGTATPTCCSPATPTLPAASSSTQTAVNFAPRVYVSPEKTPETCPEVTPERGREAPTQTNRTILKETTLWEGWLPAVSLLKERSLCPNAFESDMGSPYSSEVRSGSHGELAVNVVAIAMKSRNFDEEQNGGDEGSDRCKHGNDNQGESYHADDRGNSGQIESPEGRSLPLAPCIMTLGGMEFAASTVVAADEEGKEEDEEEVDCHQQDPQLLGRAKAKSPTQAQAETPAARSPSEVKTVRSATSDYDAESLFVRTPSPSPEVDVNLGLPAPAPRADAGAGVKAKMPTRRPGLRPADSRGN